MNSMPSPGGGAAGRRRLYVRARAVGAARRGSGGRRGASSSHRARRRMARLALVLLSALALAPRVARAQAGGGGEWFPGTRRFAPLLADPYEIRLGAGLGWTDLFDPGKQARERPPFAFPDPEDMVRDLQAMVSLGGTLPLWSSSTDPSSGAVFAVQAGVFARFRIEVPSRDYAASDWVVAFPLEWSSGPLSLRARVLHRSSHLGDEVIYDTGARRIEYGHEAFDFVVGYRVIPSTRLYGGTAWIFRSNTEHEPLLLARTAVQDNAAYQLGFDGEWPLGADGRVTAVAGLDWQTAQRTDWSSQLTAAAGIGAHGAGGGLRLLLRYFSGTSTAGEFFLTDESYWELETVVTR